MDGSGDGSLLGKLVELVHGPADSRCVDFTSLGDENHVTVHVARGLVVLAVRNFPRKVRDEESRVQNPTDSVIDGL